MLRYDSMSHTTDWTDEIMECSQVATLTSICHSHASVVGNLALCPLELLYNTWEVVKSKSRLIYLASRNTSNSFSGSPKKSMMLEETLQYMLSTFELFLVVLLLIWLPSWTDFFAYISESPAVGWFQQWFLHLIPQNTKTHLRQETLSPPTLSSTDVLV